MVLGNVKVHGGRSLGAQISVLEVKCRRTDHVCAARAGESYAAPDAINDIELHISNVSPCRRDQRHEGGVAKVTQVAVTYFVKPNSGTTDEGTRVRGTSRSSFLSGEHSLNISSTFVKIASRAEALGSAAARAASRERTPSDKDISLSSSPVFGTSSWVPAGLRWFQVAFLARSFTHRARKHFPRSVFPSWTNRPTGLQSVLRSLPPRNIGSGHRLR
jgi:hypothetical protein